MLPRHVIFDKVRRIIATHLRYNHEDIYYEHYLKDTLKADSLDLVELFFMIEEAFSITISDTVANEIETVEDIVNCVEASLKQKEMSGTQKKLPGELAREFDLVDPNFYGEQDDSGSESSSPQDVNRRSMLSVGTTLGAGLAPAILFPGSVPPADAASPAVAVPTTKLGSLTISRTIQGYWQLAGGHGPVKEADAIRHMEAHYKAGITTLDTADIYGPSESIVGKFVGTKEPSAVPCTKFCCFRGLQTIAKEDVKARVQKACDRLQVASLPLVAFFWADYSVKRYTDVALMLTELKEEGLIQEIGVTNFDTKRLKEMTEAGVPIVSNQVQFSLLDQRPERSGMREYCAENAIKLIAFGTVGAGILSEKYLGKPPPSGGELDAGGFSLRMYSATAQRAGSWNYVQELLQVLNTIAQKHNVAIANVAQRYLIDQPGVGALLIGVRNTNHIKENVATYSFTLDDDDRIAIASVLAKAKGPVGDVWDIERGG